LSKPVARLACHRELHLVTFRSLCCSHGSVEANLLARWQLAHRGLRLKRSDHLLDLAFALVRGSGYQALGIRWRQVRSQQTRSSDVQRPGFDVLE